MRAVVQRVTEADVTVQGSRTGSIQRGLVVLLGVEDGDTKKDVDYIADKVSGLRIFDDSEGVMNRTSEAEFCQSHSLRFWQMHEKASGRAISRRQDRRRQRNFTIISI